MHFAIIASHPIQYHAPLYRELARQVDLTVFFAHCATAVDQANAGFGVKFDWDVDLLSGYHHEFLPNVSTNPGLDTFASCDTPNIRNLLAESRFCAVLVMGWHLKSYIQAILAGKRLGLPVLARGDSHLQTPRRVLKKAAKAFLYPIFLRSFDAALYVGRRSRAYWKHYGYPSARLFFSPHCVDTRWFAERATAEARMALRDRLGIGADRKVALLAGKLLPIKRPLDLLAAAKRLRSEGRDLVILVAGAGPMENEIVTAARDMGITLHMLGFCNQSQMPQAYAAADVVVLPSGSETWGLVANEALASGRPVVLSDAVGAAPDLAEDGSAGRVFRSTDSVALAAILQDVMDHPPTAAAIAAKSTAYSVDAAADGIVQAAHFSIRNRRCTG